jgi:hypothetical protein
MLENKINSEIPNGQKDERHTHMFVVSVALSQ